MGRSRSGQQGVTKTKKVLRVYGKMTMTPSPLFNGGIYGIF